jgi:hypothetical protein
VRSAAISQVASTARPQFTAAVISTGRLRRRVAGLAFLRAGAGRALRDPPRDAALELLVRAPERAAVLLAMDAKPSLMNPICTISNTGHKMVSIRPPRLGHPDSATQTVHDQTVHDQTVHE